jgi:hypothetical protein
MRFCETCLNHEQRDLHAEFFFNVCHPFCQANLVFLVHANLFILSCPSSPVSTVMSILLAFLSCPSFVTVLSCPSFPVHSSCPSCVHPFLSILSCLSFPVLPVILSRPSLPFHHVLSVLSCPFFPAHYVLFNIHSNCPTLPVNPVRQSM